MPGSVNTNCGPGTGTTARAGGQAKSRGSVKGPQRKTKKTKKTFYRCYRNFDNERFEKELQKQLFSVSDFESFHFPFQVISNQFDPLKQKLLQNNNQCFMTKTFRKAIMKRFKLRSKFNEERNIENWFEYKRQLNICSHYLKQSKK